MKLLFKIEYKNYIKMLKYCAWCAKINMDEFVYSRANYKGRKL